MRAVCPRAPRSRFLYFRGAYATDVHPLVDVAVTERMRLATEAVRARAAPAPSGHPPNRRRARPPPLTAHCAARRRQGEEFRGQVVNFRKDGTPLINDVYAVPVRGDWRRPDAVTQLLLIQRFRPANIPLGPLPAKFAGRKRWAASARRCRRR